MTFPIRVDSAYVRETLARLVAIDSVNPSLIPGASGEATIAAYVATALEALGLEVAQEEPQSGRASVVGRLPGRGGGRSLMLHAHLDTVGVGGMTEPFTPVVRDGRLFGRGAFDMKGGLAACLGAARALVEAGAPLRGDVLVVGAADEEHASLGTASLLATHRTDGAIVTEPTRLALCLAHKGFVWLEVETEGRAAHGSRPDLGVDANLRMGRVLAELERLEAGLRGRPPHPLLGPPSLHAARLEGGTALSVYAARCRLGVERRTLPGETTEDVEAELRAILERLRERDPEFRASLRVLLAREPFEARPGSDVARAVSDAARQVLGSEPPVCGETPWMDAALLAAAGIDTVVIGPSGGGAHASEEWVELESVERLTEVLAHAALRYCG